MCVQVFTDIFNALFNPPEWKLDREILLARLNAYWARLQYFIFHATTIGLLYAFKDSLLNVAVVEKDYLFIASFHSIQMITILSFYITTFIDPGFINTPTESEFQREIINADSSESEMEENNPFKKPNATSNTRNQSGRAYLDVNVQYTFEDTPTDLRRQCRPYKVVQYAPAYSRKIIVDPDNGPSNYCWRCEHIRPIRSKHCYDCDHCVGKFDHHCPLVGNCIGARNHRFFVLYLVAQSACILWSFYITTHSLFQFGKPIPSQINSRYVELCHIENVDYSHRSSLGWVLRVSLFVFLFLATFVSLGLAGYHCYLAATNQTTYEMIKPQVLDEYLRDEIKRKRKYQRLEANQNAIDLFRKKQMESPHLADPPDRTPDQQEQERNDKDKGNNDGNGNKDQGQSAGNDLSSSDHDQVDVMQILSMEREPNAVRQNGVKPAGTPAPFGNGRGRDDKVNYIERESKHYFDEGLCRNIMMFLTAEMYPEWKSALPCIDRTVPATN